jgi:hypothetical protein
LDLEVVDRYSEEKVAPEVVDGYSKETEALAPSLQRRCLSLAIE